LRIEPSPKGPDSINSGIDILHRYPLCITRRSKNILNELQHYAWHCDHNGRYSNRPIDDYNHSIDAIRYVALYGLRQVKEPRYGATVQTFHLPVCQMTERVRLEQ
jgi:phage terminase large subunit